MYGYMYAIRIYTELEELPELIPELNDNYKFVIVLDKLGIILNGLISFDTPLQLIKNHTFESMNLLDDIRGSIE
ncbi:hypothetical protein [Paraliobacillus ryukyuensis]|uniref:hypothetical protein n=1 Tax=Paraliobacillus ryukyuensis TaxID=200904 RepID=UPI00117E78D7|nr:hypothetical protein [Paraliobacillus ryukyuensis]